MVLKGTCRGKRKEFGGGVSTMLKTRPKVDEPLEWPRIRALLGEHPRPVLVKAVRDVLAALRAEAIGGAVGMEAFSEENVAERVLRELAAANALSLKRVVNGTGVVIHTNLGRSPLPESVRRSLLDVAFGYSNLEFDLAQGVRGSRYSHVERLW